MYLYVIEKQAPRSQQCLIHRKKNNQYGKTLTSALERLSVHLAEYQHIFRNRTKKFFDKAEKYAQGIVQSQMRNIERISEESGTDYYQMQHFISESKWDAREVVNQVALEVSTVLPKRKLTGLIIDESGWVKKGDKSVGVGWQYCGNVGKISNSQVAVFACLSNGDFASMIDSRLYLPKDWCDDPERCYEAERKGTKGPMPKRLKATTDGISVCNYLKTLDRQQWQKLSVRNTTKGVLTGEYHFARVYIWDKATDQTEQRLLVIRKTKSGKATVEIKYSFTNANLEQYTPEALAYMQAERFFIEHCIKEAKDILGLDQFQTRKWLAWHHQVALNFSVSSFILKEKLRCFEDLPLLSARDI